MSHLKIFGIAKSRAFRVLWTASELGLAYEHVPVGFGEEGCRQPWFRAINPNGQVPAIDDGGFVLWESLAIDLYLAKKHGTGTLYPADIEGEARAWQWTLWVATEVEGAVITVLRNTVMLPEARRDAAAAASALERLKKPLAVLDAALASSPYLLGPDFTIADLNVAAVLYTARANRVALPAGPNVGAWLDRCLERPGARAARKLRE